MRKVVSVLLVFVTSIMFFTGCSSTKLSDAFDEEVLKEKAKEVVAYMDAEDYQEVCNLFDATLQGILPPERLQEGKQGFKDIGEFKEYKSIAVVGSKVKETDEDTAVAVLVAAYENKNITYTLSFNTDLKLIGIYMK